MRVRDEVDRLGREVELVEGEVVKLEVRMMGRKGRGETFI